MLDSTKTENMQYPISNDRVEKTHGDFNLEVESKHCQLENSDLTTTGTELLITSKIVVSGNYMFPQAKSNV